MDQKERQARIYAMSKFLKLVHNRRLKRPKPPKTLEPRNAFSHADVMVSFRDLGTAQETLPIDGSTRFDRFQRVPYILFAFVEEDSPFALPLIGDALHSMDVGALVEFVGTAPNPIVERSYFSDAFQREKDGSRIVYRKIKPCLAETEAGLQDWSFCIPVGPGDATGLNLLVERISSFKELNFEILLAGRPGENFRHLDKVRIVPEQREGVERPIPGVNICEKKNILVEHAKYSNICLMHDRVFLPSDFPTAMKSFGEIYALHTLQSLYFDDYRNCAPIRYSDYNVFRNAAAFDTVVSLSRDRTGLSAFAPAAVWRTTKQAGFQYQHPLCYQEGNYATGSLYICKRAVWKAFPLDECVKWGECEDVELGLRMTRGGVAHRLNPYTVTQSLNFRPIVIHNGLLHTLSMKGKRVRAKIPLPLFGGAKRKPFYRRSEQSARAELEKFASVYLPDNTAIDWDDVRVSTSREWIALLMRVADRVEVPQQPESLRKFILAWANAAHMDTSDFEQHTHLRNMLTHGDKGLRGFLKEHPHFNCLEVMRPGGSLFTESGTQLMPEPSTMLKVGSLLSATRLYLSRHKQLYLKGGIRAYYDAILNSTPVGERQ